jgi:hypothetical protein
MAGFGFELCSVWESTWIMMMMMIGGRRGEGWFDFFFLSLMFLSVFVA